MDAKYPKPVRPAVPMRTMDHEAIDIAEAGEMLGYIPPDCARDEWVSVGMALRDEYGDAANCLWHTWSSGGSTYKASDAQACWRSFGGEGYTIATIVYLAKRGGWIKQSEIPVKIKKKQEPALADPEIGGIVKEIADWITATAVRPQPALSMAAAIAFMATIKGHRVKSSLRGARTNMLVMSLAPTGGGKDYPQEAISKLAQVCGLGKMMMGRPTSGTALLTGLNKAGGVSLLKVDEIGRYLSNIADKGAQSHQREIVDYMVELYSAANRTFYGRQYANERENPQIILEQPHFCCIGSTVSEKFKSACKSGEVIDGFLNRWLVFVATDKPKKNLSAKDYTPPPALVNKIMDWLTAFPVTPEPREIELTREAWDIFLAFEDTVERKMDKAPYPINELYARAAEQVVKLATALADGLWVGQQEIQAAIGVVEQSLRNVIEFASGLSDNQHEANVVYVLQTIREAGGSGIAKDSITQKTRRLNNRERSDILNQLVESGEVNTTKDGKRITFFSA